MNKQVGLLKKTLVIGINILFVGIAVQPSIATTQTEDTIDLEPKDYLFQTIIDIANNPVVKNLLELYENDLIKASIDRSVYHKILFRNPCYFYSLIFTKPSITYGYLDFVYNHGIEITNVLGEDKTLETIESFKVTNIEVFDELNNIITNDEVLSDRIETLKELNKELKPDSPLQDWPLICYILGSIILSIVFLYELSETNSIIGFIVWLITLPFIPFIAMFGLFIYSIGVIEGCWDWP